MINKKSLTIFILHNILFSPNPKAAFFHALIKPIKNWERIINKQIIVIHFISFGLIIADIVLIVGVSIVLPIRIRDIVLLLALLTILRIVILIHLVSLLIIWIYSCPHSRIHPWCHSRIYSRAHTRTHTWWGVRIGVIRIWIIGITHRIIRVSWVELATAWIRCSTWCTGIHRIVIHRVIRWIRVKWLGEFLLWSAYHRGWLRVRSWHTWISLIMYKSTVIYFTASLRAW